MAFIKNEMKGEKLHRNVKVSALGSFFTDISTEMILPILPTFIVGILKAPTTALGLIEGVAETTASLFKLVSGYISDKLKKRKPIVILGYSFSAIVKPLLAVATSWAFVLFVRFLDRVGKGIRTSPRDALIADSTGKNKGRSFGFHRFMDTLGAVTGTLISFLILKFSLSEINTYRKIFVLSFIPAALAVMILLFGLKEIPISEKEKRDFAKEKTSITKELKLFLFISFIFTLSNFSYAFYLLRAKELGSPDWMLPILYLINTVTYAIISYPAGIISDSVGGKNVLAAGYLLYALTAILFGIVNRQWFPFIGFALYGAFQGITETGSKVVVASLSKSETRGRAYGVYHTTVGLAALPSSLLAGFIWKFFGGKNAFFLGFALATISFVIFLFTMYGKTRTLSKEGKE